MNLLKKPSTTGGIIYLVVLGALFVGLGVVAYGAWRTGISVMGCAFGLAFLARAVLPEERAGMLRVRRRYVDLTALAICCTGMIILATVIPQAPA
ncbi:MAG: DUF3017 domain-containing protein [Nocardioidaceae bacterium]|nr:DUF3017 domain-containing protein [Nocardioidaceae bacterium]